MTLKPKPEHTCYVVLQEYLGRGKSGKSRSITVYDLPFEEVYKRIVEAFKQ